MRCYVRKIFFRSAYNYDTVEASDASAHVPVGESLTVQSMAEDADINVIMRRFGITGKFPENPRVPQYGDFSFITDFQSAMDAVNSAEEGFMEYPAELRARFSNSPQKFLEFCSLESNRDEMVKLGLMKTAPQAPTPPAKPAGEGA